MKRYIMAGLLVWVPLGITIYVILWLVGTLDQTGLFTPNLDGPNPARSSNRNNVGDVWVVASYQPPDKSARPLKARAHLIVTVPLYVKFVPWRTQP